MFWEFFKKNEDGTVGYNDWRVVEIVPKKKIYNKEDDQRRKAVTVRGIGQTMAFQVLWVDTVPSILIHVFCSRAI